jgi:hypothetical protein
MKSQIPFDARDVDNMVADLNQAQMSRRIFFGKAMLDNASPEMMFYWKDFIRAHYMALEIAQWLDVPPKRKSIPKVIKVPFKRQRKYTY